MKKKVGDIVTLKLGPDKGKKGKIKKFIPADKSFQDSDGEEGSGAGVEIDKIDIVPAEDVK